MIDSLLALLAISHSPLLLLSHSHSVRCGDLLRVARDTAVGLHHLHQHNIIHRDLALRNVLCELLRGQHLVRAKVCDFGLSRAGSCYYRGRTGHTMRAASWSAPEALEREMYTAASDVFSFGVVLWELFTLGRVPYASLPRDGGASVLAHLHSGQRLEQPDACPDAVYDLMLQCWQLDPQQR